MLKQVIVLLFTIGMVCSALIDQPHQQNQLSLLKQARSKRELEDEEIDIEAIIEKMPELRKIFERLDGDKKAIRELARFAELTEAEREEFYKNGGLFPGEKEEKRLVKGVRKELRILGKLGGAATLGGVISGALTASDALNFVGGIGGLLLVG